MMLASRNGCARYPAHMAAGATSHRTQHIFTVLAATQVVAMRSEVG